MTVPSRSMWIWDVFVGGIAVYLPAAFVIAIATYEAHFVLAAILVTTAVLAAGVVWAAMLGDVVRWHFESHSRPAKIWHALLLIMPLSAFAYYVVRWRSRRVSPRSGPPSEG